MKFTVSQSSFAQAVSVVTKGMGFSSTLALLSGIYIRAKEGTLELQSTDLTISIKHKVAANVEEEGETVVSGKILANIVKNLPDAAVEMEEMGRQASITCGKSNYRLNTLDPTDFPEFPQFDVDSSVELPSAALSSMVDKVYRVTSKDTSRPILAGILLNVENNVIRLVATDSYRLAVCDTTVETSGVDEAFSAIIAGNTLHDVLSLPSVADSIYIGINANQVMFKTGDTTYVSRKIEGNFPDYRKLLPTSFVTSVTMNVQSLVSALKRVSVIALNNPSVRFDVDVDGSLMQLSATTPDYGDAREYIDVDVQGESMNISLNNRYVFDCVNAVDSDSELTLELQSTMQPAIFKAYGKINYLYLLMPVRM